MTPITLCEACAAQIGGAAAGPDAPWRLATGSEPCEAYDHAPSWDDIVSRVEDLVAKTPFRLEREANGRTLRVSMRRDLAVIAVLAVDTHMGPRRVVSCVVRDAIGHGAMHDLAAELPILVRLVDQIEALPRVLREAS